MERLIKIDTIKPKHSKDVKVSRLGLGFEKLDRDVFDPEKAYDKVAELGVKWIRLQSGWAKTEKVKGVYDFSWLDKIVDNLISRGLIPWICLCYGNGLYTPEANKYFGAVGCPPIHTDEEKQGWANYVKAIVSHFEGRVNHYEVWNEPDGKWCWKHGPNGTEYGNFVIHTAKAIKEINKDIYIIGGSICRRKIDFLNAMLKTGAGDYIDGITYHEYTPHDQYIFSRVDAIRAIVDMYNPKIELIQGESGSQSRSGGCGAVKSGCWTQRRQAKQLLRHQIADLITETKFTSYFSCIDMIEALNGTSDNKASYMDFGYFGVLGAEFDENGTASGNYSPKKSYYAYQNICSLFADDVIPKKAPFLCKIYVGVGDRTGRTFDFDLEQTDIIYGGFYRQSTDAYAFAYYYPSNIMTTEYEGTISIMAVAKDKDDLRLIDPMDGSVYKIPDDMFDKEDYNEGVFADDNTFQIMHLPVKDYPLILCHKDFIR